MAPATTGETATAGPTPDTGALIDALRQLRDALAGTRFRLATPSADSARDERARLVAQLDDYLLPRLDRLDAPLLVVVGGSTGAGKSTLLNSLVGAAVSPAGVLRPTTRSPLLAGNPADAPWFAQRRLLPSFSRAIDGPDPGHPHDAQLQLIVTPALPAGVALLDAPDIDSVVADNRDLAAELMDAADLWLFVTTASRYADAVPWDVLETARDRGVQLAVAIDRVPPGGERPVGAHLAQLMERAGLSAAPLFVLPEAVLDAQGLLPDEVVEPIRSWFLRLAADGGHLDAVVRQTVDGAVRALTPRCQPVIEAVTEQSQSATVLRTSIIDARGHATDATDAALSHGALIHGEPLARWHALTDDGDLLRALRARAGRRRDSVVAALAGRTHPGRAFRAALDEALSTAIADAVTGFDDRVTAAWTAEQAGAALLANTEPPADAGGHAAALVADWHHELLELIRNDRTSSSRTTYTMSALELLILVTVFVDPARSTPALLTAANSEEIRDLLDATAADPTVRRIAPQARDSLRTAVTSLIDTHRQHFVDLLDPVLEPGVTDIALRAALSEVNRAHSHTPLAPTATPLPPATPPRPKPTPIPPAPPEPETSQATAPETDPAEPAASEPAASEPAASEPAASEPAASEPAAHEAEAHVAEVASAEVPEAEVPEAAVAVTEAAAAEAEMPGAEAPEAEETLTDEAQAETTDPDASVTDLPRTDLPSEDAPDGVTPAEGCTAEEPTVEEPTVEEPTVEEPTPETPATEESASEVPAPEDSAFEDSAPEERSSDEASAEAVTSEGVAEVEASEADAATDDPAGTETSAPAAVGLVEVTKPIGAVGEGQVSQDEPVTDNDHVREDVGAGKDDDAGGEKSDEARS